MLHFFYKSPKPLYPLPPWPHSLCGASCSWTDWQHVGPCTMTGQETCQDSRKAVQHAFQEVAPSLCKSQSKLGLIKSMLSARSWLYVVCHQVCGVFFQALQRDPDTWRKPYMKSMSKGDMIKRITCPRSHCRNWTCCVKHAGWSSTPHWRTLYFSMNLSWTAWSPSGHEGPKVKTGAPNLSLKQMACWHRSPLPPSLWHVCAPVISLGWPSHWACFSRVHQWTLSKHTNRSTWWQVSSRPSKRRLKRSLINCSLASAVSLRLQE